jgi:ABC-type antimicrobial peptide transport system permease subunit
MFAAIKTVGDPRRVLRAVHQQVAKLDAGLPIYEVRTMEERLSASVGLERLNVVLIGAFGLLALVLAAAGIYGVISYSVAQRKRELAVRVALGATEGGIVRQILREGIVLTTVGTVMGLLLALLAGHWLSSRLYGVGATDPLAFCFAVLLLGATAFLACYVPARRAAKVHPMEALRTE